MMTLWSQIISRAFWYKFKLSYSLKQLKANAPPAMNFKSYLPIIDVFNPNQYDRTEQGLPKQVKGHIK